MGPLGKSRKIKGEKKESIPKGGWEDKELNSLALKASKGDIKALRELLRKGKRKMELGKLSEDDVERLKLFVKNLKGALDKIKKSHR